MNFNKNKPLSFHTLSKKWGWLVVILAYLFLAYKLITFNQYHQLVLQWKQMPLSRLWWLLALIALLPLNWLLEALKWQLLTAKIEFISLKTSIKAVLAGISSGFFTPNRVGELVGRVLYLSAENRKAGVTMSVLNSLTQNLIITLCGIPACLCFFYSTNKNFAVSVDNFVLMVLAAVVLVGLFYLYLPKISFFLSQTKIAGFAKEYIIGLSAFTRTDLMRILFVSLVRYLVFSVQFFLMLQFFDVQLLPIEALIAIPTTYLFVTFSPSFAFSEAAIRSSYAVFFIGAFSGLVVNIALAGMAIWVVNFVVPMLAGSIFLVKVPNPLKTPIRK